MAYQCKNPMNLPKNIIFILPLLLLFQIYLYAQPDQVRLKVRVQLLETDTTDSVYISGNHLQLGNWHPGKIVLTQTFPKIWQKDFSFTPGTSIEFKITRGSWAGEAMYRNTYSIPDNHALKMTKDTTIAIRVLNWKDDQNWSTATGTIHTHIGISGFGLKPRDLLVWLPPGYDSVTSDRYPVLYMHDGQNLFDRQSSALNAEWRLDETADSLIRQDLIRPLIIVGITNSADRSREYVDSDTGRIYMKLVTEVIKPLIDRTYRTMKNPEFTATGGSSAGGLIAFMLVWEHPEVFSKAACVSPALKIRQIDYVTDVLASPDDYHTRFFYIDNGTVGIDSLLQPGIDDMISALEKKGLIKERDYMQFIAKAAMHNEKDWARRSWRFLQQFFPPEDGGAVQIKID